MMVSHGDGERLGQPTMDLSLDTDRCRARAIGAEPIGRRVGIALFDRNPFRRNADLARQDLSESRGVPLALADRAEPRDSTPGRMYSDFA